MTIEHIQHSVGRLTHSANDVITEMRNAIKEVQPLAQQTVVPVINTVTIAQEAVDEIKGILVHSKESLIQFNKRVAGSLLIEAILLVGSYLYHFYQHNGTENETKYWDNATQKVILLFFISLACHYGMTYSYSLYKNKFFDKNKIAIAKSIIYSSQQAQSLPADSNILTQTNKDQYLQNCENNRDAIRSQSLPVLKIDPIEERQGTNTNGLIRSLHESDEELA